MLVLRLIWLFFHLEKGFQNNGNDGPDNQPQYTNAFEAEIHGKQRQQGMQTNLCSENLGLENLSHDLNDAVQCQIADGKEGIPCQKMDESTRPEDETTAEEGQCINDGNEDTQQKRIWRVHHQHTDEGDGKGKAHEDELGFDITPDGGLQLLFGCMDRKPQQRCDMLLINAADEITVFSEEISGNQRNEKGDEKAGYAADGTAAAALGQERKEHTGCIILELQKGSLQLEGKLCTKSIEQLPEILQTSLKNIYIQRKMIGTILDAVDNTRPRPESQAAKNSKQQQHTQQGRNAPGNMIWLQFIRKGIEQKAHQPADDKGQKDGRKITEKQKADQNCS